MSRIVRDNGFHADDLGGLECVTVERLNAGVEAPVVLLVEADADPAGLPLHSPWVASIRIRFPSFSDGRGFSLAFRLRQLGFAGRLSASGPLVADQYPLARRSGFDEVIIDDLMASRQPETQWLAKSNWRHRSYQQHLTGGA